MHRDNVNRAKTALAGCVLVLTVLLALVEVTAAMAKTSGSGPTRVSRCSGSSSEAAQAADPHGKYVYEAWMGCGRGGIAFARSTDGGAHFSTPVRLPGSAYGSYDPDLSVSAQGKLYASYIANTGKPTPMVLASTDHGASFPQATKITSPGPNSSADRDHIAAGPRNSVYLTWIYDPQASAIKNVCPHQYCDTRSGERDAVIQRSTDGGKTFGAPTPLGANGAFAAPLLVEGNGQVDVLLQHFHVSGKDQTLGAGAEYFTSSRDQGRSWRAPISVSTPSTTIMPRNWWMNGALARDSGGDLYVTWDARRGNGDVGLLAYSSDHGRVWSKPIQVTPGADAPHIVEPAGGPRGVAYVGWLTQQHSGAWAQYVRTFQIAHHRLTTARQVSGAAGTAAIWPGDTFGISTLPGSWLALSWGQVPPGRGGTSQIFARTLRPASPKG